MFFFFFTCAKSASENGKACRGFLINVAVVMVSSFVERRYCARFSPLSLLDGVGLRGSGCGELARGEFAERRWGGVYFLN